MLRAICLVLIALASSSCMFLKLKEDVAYLAEESTISGQVSGASESGKPVVVALVRPSEDGNYVPETYSVRYGNGAFALQNHAGEFYVMAFEDVNEDLSFQAEEPLGWWGEPTLLQAGGNVDQRNLTIALRKPHQARTELPQAYAVDRKPVVIERDTFRLGVVTDFSNDSFNDEIGAMGMWEPVKFVQGGHSGLFFLEPFDPKRKPVLFIHGITGTARDWRRLVAGIDTESLQPWVLNYPSGASIHRVADTVNAMLNELQLTHGFTSLAVVAHSMGGLLARDLTNLNLAQGERAVIDKLISISTPWGGHATAARAASAPVAVPAWYDMAPNGDFLESIFVEPLPAEVPFYLLFSYRGGSLLLGDNSDGTITLKSQLAPSAQAQATRVIGFDEDHVGILRDADSIATINGLLRD
ncbi:MAG: esterase/lipase family protein [Pseudomonadales bacterium]